MKVANFNRILSLPVLFLLTLMLAGPALQAQNKNSQTQNKKITKPSGVEMLEISPEKLPEEVHRDILENFHHAEIVKAYKVWQPGAKEHEFWVDVKQGPKRWSLQFDANGNAINKVNPVN